MKIILAFVNLTPSPMLVPAYKASLPTTLNCLDNCNGPTQKGLCGSNKLHYPSSTRQLLTYQQVLTEPLPFKKEPNHWKQNLSSHIMLDDSSMNRVFISLAKITYFPEL